MTPPPNASVAEIDGEAALATSERPSASPGVPAAVTAGDVWIVIAAYREGKVIATVVQELVALWPNVVVVDDGSDDDTRAQAAGAGATVLRHVINRGQGAALQTGIGYALSQGAAVVVTFDADGQHRPEAVERLLQPLRSGRADVVFGSRFLEDAAAVPWARRWLIRAAVAFTRLTTGAKVTDAHNGLRAFRRGVAQELELKLDRMAHASEIIDKVIASGAVYVEVPVAIRYTPYSRAKGQSGAAAFRILWDYMLSKVIS